MSLLFFDIGVPGGTIGIIAAAGFLCILAAAAYVLFRLLRKTARMAFRTAMVVTFIFAAILGVLAIYWLGVGTTSKPAPRSVPSRAR